MINPQPYSIYLRGTTGFGCCVFVVGVQRPGCRGRPGRDWGHLGPRSDEAEVTKSDQVLVKCQRFNLSPEYAGPTAFHFEVNGVGFCVKSLALRMA